MRPFVGAVILSSCLLGGCASLAGAAFANVDDEEARQLAWTGPGAGPCAFGGVTPRAEIHCAALRGGDVGALQAVNARARHAPGRSAADCQEHVETARALLEVRGELDTNRLYSCPAASRARNECHVSLLVTLPDRRRFVLDNGAVVGTAIGVAGVASFARFAEEVDGVYWLDFPPSAEDLAQLELREPLSIAAAGESARARTQDLRR